MEEREIQKGFNEGYIIAKYKPQLANVIGKSLANREDGYTIGFIAGMKEYKTEIDKARTRNYEPEQLPTKSKSLEKDKDFRDI